MPVTKPAPEAKPPDPAARTGAWQGVDFLLPLVAAVCVVLGWFVVLDYERTALALGTNLPGLLERVWRMRLMMAFGSVGGFGLAWLAARDARKRRLAEQALERLNADLANRVVRRTVELRARTKALRESRLREQLREKEAEVAFQAGLVEAAGQYLHGVGNALSSLDLELLRLSRAVDGADRMAVVFDALAGELAAGRTEAAARLAASLREAVLGRTLPRIARSRDALVELKAGMSEELERRRDEFERGGQPVRYFQSFRLDVELAAVLDRLPGAAGGDQVVRDIASPVTVRTRKHTFLTGLAALLRQALDTAYGPVTVRLRQEAEGRAVLVVEGAILACSTGSDVAAFINFLNENNGAFRFEPVSPGQAAAVIVTIAPGPSDGTESVADR